MPAYLSPVGNEQQFDSNGTPLSGGLIYTYQAGTSTPIVTYTENTGVTPQANPIVLNSAGLPASPIWLPAGQAVKLVFLKSDLSTARPTIDNVLGVNDPSAISVDQWIIYTGAATFVSATSFTVAGDQTNIFQSLRRVKTTNTGGTIYSTVSNSVFGAGITTVTVINDAGVIDSGLSSVAYGLLSAMSPSVPEIEEPDIKPVSASVAANALTLTIGTCALNFRSTTLTSGATVQRTIGAPISVVVPNTATLGTVNAIGSRLAILAIDNAGTVEAAVINLAGGNNLDETGLITTTAVSVAADLNNVAYSTTARANVAYRVAGFIDITEATAGVWATAPTLVQGASVQSISMSSLGYGQFWTDVSGSRSITTTFYNTTGRPIMVVVNMNLPIGANAQGIVAGLSVSFIGAPTAASNLPITLIVPPGQSYSVGIVAGAPVVGTWKELR